MQHHINRTVSTHNLVGTAKNFYTPHRKNKIFHTTTTILIWHFLRYASKTSTVMQQLDQVRRIFLIIYNRIGQRRVTQKGPNGYFIGRWFWLAQSVKSHPQLGVVGLLAFGLVFFFAFIYALLLAITIRWLLLLGETIILTA